MSCPTCGAPFIGALEDFSRNETRTIPKDATHVCRGERRGRFVLAYHSPAQIAEVNP